MAYGRLATVRSHRRGRPRRRLGIAPWIVVAVVAVLVLSGLSAGYAYLVRRSCSGEVRATIVASPSMATLLDGLARSWAESEPAVAGTCAAVEIGAKDSALMAQQLGTEWDVKAGQPPDVWVPDSAAWVRRASSAAIAERMMPDLQPSIARTPTVIAMPKPMAEALGWPTTQLSWQDIIGKYAAGPGWSAAGQPAWGEFRLGMTDPLKSTAGLLALMAVLDANDDGEVTAEEQAGVLKLKQVRRVYEDNTDKIFAALQKEDAQSSDAALKYLSAFPALEQEVLTYNQSNPKVPLVAVYPSNGSADADHPYLVLNADWADQRRQDVARSFLSYVRGPEGRNQILAAGFRDANRTAGKPLTQVNGFAAKVATLPRAVLLPDSVQQSMDTWTALTRPTNVLLVLDVSGSMAEQVPGTGRSRLAFAKEAARGAVTLFSEDTQVGLWVFATRLDGTRDHRQVVPLGPLSEALPGSRTRRETLLAGIDRLAPGGDTGLYDTAVAAHRAVLEAYRQGATNLVVLMTDGKNDDDTGGLSLEQARDTLTRANADPTRRVPLVTVGYGNDADFGALREISRATGAVSYTSRTGFDINQVLLTAIFGRV